MPAMASRGRGRRTINEINMVPFIDVMLVLLIIFMVTAPMLTPGMIDVPSVGKGKNMPKVVAQVIVNKDGSLQFKTPDATRSLNQREIGRIDVDWTGQCIECRNELALLRVCEGERGKRGQISLEGLRFDFFGERSVGFDALVDADLGDQQEIGQAFK